MNSTAAVATFSGSRCGARVAIAGHVSAWLTPGQPVLHISQRQPIHHSHGYKYGHFVGRVNRLTQIEGADPHGRHGQRRVAYWRGATEGVTRPFWPSPSRILGSGR